MKLPGAIFGMIMLCVNWCAGGEINIITNSEYVYVLHGRLITYRTEEYMGVAQYQVEDSENFILPGSSVEISFPTSTVKGVIQTNAILLLTWFAPGPMFKPIGDQAWRGILPFTSDEYERLSAGAAYDLALPKPGTELSRRDAKASAIKEIIRRGDYGDIVEWKFVRRPLHWLVAVQINVLQGGEIIPRRIRMYIDDMSEVYLYNYTRPMYFDAYDYEQPPQ